MVNNFQEENYFCLGIGCLERALLEAGKQSVERTQYKFCSGFTEATEIKG